MDSIFNEITKETAELIAAQARAHGLTADEYLRTLLQPHAAETGQRPLYAGATPQELAKAYAEWAASHDPNAPVILDDGREAIYEDGTL